MRKFTRLSLSTAALLAAAGPTFADPSGFISGGLGVVSYNYEDFNASGPSASARGSGTVELTPALNLQGDVVLDFRRFNFDGDHRNVFDLTGALHLFYRDPGTFLAGGFVQVTRSNATSSDAPDLEEDNSRWLAGFEGQAYLGDVTLYGQVGYLRESLYYDYSQSGFFGTAQLRYFLTPDLKLDVHGVLAHLSNPDYSDSGLTTVGVGVGVEYKLPESAFSVFGTADYLTNQKDSGSSDTDTHVMVGIKFNFDADSLFDQDRIGTSLDPYPSLPFYSGGAS
jgi:hypothetical protein